MILTHYRHVPAFLTVWAVALAGAPLPAHGAKSLTQVLDHVHQTHPRLQAARSSLRAEQEGVPSALAAFLPTVSVSGELGRSSFEQERDVEIGGFLCRPGAFLREPSNPLSCDPADRIPVTLRGEAPQINTFYGGATNPSYVRRTAQGSLNLFRSGADVAQYRSARRLVDRQEALYRNVEQDVLLQTIRAYLELRLARQTIVYRESNLEALKERGRVTRAQFEIQDKTLADLEQVRARVAVAESDLALARAVEKQAAATFLRVVGELPGADLSEVEAASGMAPTLEAAIAAARDANPRVQAAYAAWLSSVQQARRALAQGAGPSLDFIGNISEDHSREDLVGDITRWSLAFRLNVPIYQGGAVGAAVRRARHQVERAHDEYLDEVRAVRESVTRAWEDYLAAQARKDSLQEAVRAARVALETVRLEVGVGQRLVVDALDASRDLVNNQVSLEQARRDWLLAGYSLRSHTGDLTGPALGLAERMPRRKGFQGLAPELLAPVPYQLWRHRDVYREAE